MADGDAGKVKFTLEPAGAAADEGKRQAQRDRIIEAVLAAGVGFWRDADGNAFARVKLPGGGLARYRVRSRAFALVVRALYGDVNPRAVGATTIPGSVSDTAMQEALPALEAVAFGQPVLEPEVRVAGFAGAVWLDLGRECWRAVRIDAQGWKVVDRTDAPLIRPDGMRPLPEPARVPSNEALTALAALTNSTAPDGMGEAAETARDAAQRRVKLFVAWLLGTLHPTGPFALLAVDGEQGSAKTTTGRVLRRLVDPCKGELRAPPRNRDDLIVAAQNSRVVALDNLSHLDAELADDLCRLATGGGLSKRAHYTNGEEYIMDAARPVLLNGIPSLLARGDLADRALAVTLPPIPDAQRRPEAEVWRDFEAAAPGILGLLLDGLAMALRDMPTLRLSRLPRMADFARLACAAAPAFGWTAEEMLHALEGNRADAIEAVIEADPVAVAVRSLLPADNDGKPLPYANWTGTATALLEEVNRRVLVEAQRERGYPKDAARLSARLKRIAPALRRAGIEVGTVREAGTGQRTVMLTPVTASSASHSVTASQPGEEQGLSCDAPAPTVTLAASQPKTASQPKPRKSAVCDAVTLCDAVSPATGAGHSPDAAPRWTDSL